MSSTRPLVVFVSTYAPRKCGIATYAKSLLTALHDRYSVSFDTRVVSMTRKRGAHYRFDKQVIGSIAQFHQEEYVRTAQRLNRLNRVKLVHIQHEYGIYGGAFGEYLLDFVKTLQKPFVITFHTVLPSPEEKLEKVTRELITRATLIHVMTEQAKGILMTVYGVEEGKICVIPHGIPPMVFKTSDEAKLKLGLGTKTVLMTFGLLSRNKGIEYVIQALPEIVKKYPDVLYVVAGATHPVVFQEEGEAYRVSLKTLVKELGLEKHVRFHNRFLDDEELSDHLYAADIYIATPLDPNQAVSGTLSYAFGSGRPVISTAFAQAKELVTSDVGRLVHFRRPTEYKAAIDELLNDRERLSQMGLIAYQRAHKTRWSNVAIATIRCYAAASPEIKQLPMNLPAIRLETLTRITGEHGVIQFSKLAVPDLGSGYTIDDNARALVAATHYYALFKKKDALPLIQKYLDFLRFSAQPGPNFSNYIDSEHHSTRQNGTEDLEDCAMRSFQSLAYVASKKSLPHDFHRKAVDLLLAYFNAHPKIEHPRSKAFFIKGLYSIWKTHIGLPLLEERIKEQCDHLLALYQKEHSKDWDWFESSLTYANSILPEALFIGWKVTKNKRYLEVAKRTLDFLIKQTAHEDYYIPIGQDGWHERGGVRSMYDQQAEDPSYLVQSLNTIYKLTKDERYRSLRDKVFSWFLGNNSIAHTMYDEQSAGCYDGLQKDSVNLNQGAESAISYFLARLCVGDA